MSVYKKLNEARSKFHSMQLKKSGHNKFAGYQFFELQDFILPALRVFNECGICGVVSFKNDEATLTIVDIENPNEQIVISSPMSEANLKGCHPIQNLGAVQTYLRRYLWVSAMEIVEHDALDATTGGEEPTKKVTFVKPKEAPKPEATKEPISVEGKDLPWQIKVEEKEPGAWKDAAVNAALLLLDMAESSSDVMQIFKVNRSIFDKLKAEELDTYNDLMAKFTEYKTKFNKE